MQKQICREWREEKRNKLCKQIRHECGFDEIDLREM